MGTIDPGNRGWHGEDANQNRKMMMDLVQKPTIHYRMRGIVAQDFPPPELQEFQRMHSYVPCDTYQVACDTTLVHPLPI